MSLTRPLSDFFAYGLLLSVVRESKVRVQTNRTAAVETVFTILKVQAIYVAAEE